MSGWYLEIPMICINGAKMLLSKKNIIRVFFVYLNCFRLFRMVSERGVQNNFHIFFYFTAV